MESKKKAGYILLFVFACLILFSINYYLKRESHFGVLTIISMVGIIYFGALYLSEKFRKFLFGN